MRVKIETEGVFEVEGKAKRHGKGSVVEVSAGTFELNQSWMKPTDEPVKFVEPAKEKAAPAES